MVDKAMWAGRDDRRKYRIEALICNSQDGISATDLMNKTPTIPNGQRQQILAELIEAGTIEWRTIRNGSRPRQMYYPKGEAVTRQWVTHTRRDWKAEKYGLTDKQLQSLLKAECLHDCMPAMPSHFEAKATGGVNVRVTEHCPKSRFRLIPLAK